MLDTICALSSGALPSGVAVIRVSGPGVPEVAERLLAGPPLEPRRASLRTIRTADGDTLDRGLALVFGQGSSATGEHLLELHLHGGRAVVQSVLQTLTSIPEVRLAQAGEFTERAFRNGLIDLASAEALADLVDAETEMQRRQAVANFDGRQAKLYEGWREQLIECRAMIEAELDFSDEEDIPGAVSDRIWLQVAALRQSIGRQIEAGHAAEIVREGFRVVLAGQPNAGKSSLFNALVNRDAAIVTPVPGTTRDAIEASVDMGGYKIVLIDTAGLRHTKDEVEAIGVERATKLISTADLVLLLDATDLPPMTAPVLRIASKADLQLDADMDAGLIRVSAVTGEGLDNLRQEIVHHVGRATSLASSTLPSRLRHCLALEQALRALDASLNDSSLLEIRAEYLRLAADYLGSITGHIGVEALLDTIFSRFCIGK